jgi:2-polyprenyl-3-methyl-5-hydroxy-6-metoxy-1,4-benzoquinol methylase
MLLPVTGGSPSSIDICSTTAEGLAVDYQELDQAAFRQSCADLLPGSAGRLMLDIGAGSGLDATWLADPGFEVAAAEPSRDDTTIARPVIEVGCASQVSVLII